MPNLYVGKYFVKKYMRHDTSAIIALKKQCEKLWMNLVKLVLGCLAVKVMLSSDFYL